MCPVVPFWFCFCEPKCSSEVSEPKWASVQTILCDVTTDTVNVTAQAWGQTNMSLGSYPRPSPSYVPVYWY